MRVTFAAPRVALDLDPLPSGLDAVILFAPAALWEALGEAQRGEALALAARHPSASRRDVSWRAGPGVSLWWCGPIAYGGDLHRSLLRTITAPLARAGNLFAIDWRTGEERPLRPPRRRPPGGGDDEVGDGGEGGQAPSSSPPTPDVAAAPTSAAPPAAATAAPQRRPGRRASPTAAPTAAPTAGPRQASVAHLTGA